jgi:hypothetical protein
MAHGMRYASAAHTHAAARTRARGSTSATRVPVGAQAGRCGCCCCLKATTRAAAAKAPYRPALALQRRAQACRRWRASRRRGTSAALHCAVRATITPLRRTHAAQQGQQCLPHARRLTHRQQQGQAAPSVRVCVCVERQRDAQPRRCVVPLCGRRRHRRTNVSYTIKTGGGAACTPGQGQRSISGDCVGGGIQKRCCASSAICAQETGGVNLHLQEQPSYTSSWCYDTS